MCGKFDIKLKNCHIGEKICVVVDIDTPIMIVVYAKICGKNYGKIEKLSDWNKNWCGKIQKKTVSRRILEQGGQRTSQF